MTTTDPAKASAFDQPLPVRMLNEYAYCPRLFHLEHVEGLWEDNHFTIEGRAAHRRVDQFDSVLDGPKSVAEDATDAGGDEPPKIARSVSLESERLGLTGKLDLVSTAGDEAVPVAVSVKVDVARKALFRRRAPWSSTRPLTG